ncbi:MAG: GYD domain-containing protein [Desulfobacterales bacterium]
MPTYISLVNFTQQGIDKIKESPARLDSVKKLFDAAGGKLINFYLVMGRYYVVFIGEAPDDKTAAKIALTIGSKGAVRTETLKAFSEDEYRNIIAELP